MKVKATYRHVFEVTREVEVDEADFEAWLSGRMWSRAEHDRSLAIAAYLDEADAESTSEVFKDWRFDRPLPADFELQYSEVMDIIEPESGGSES